MTDTTFIKSFRGNGVMLKKELTANEIATLVFLMDFISYKDCVLRKNGDYRGKALDIHDLAEMLDVKYDTLRRTMYSLRDKEVLGFHTTGTQGNSTNWITVNPFIFCRGMKLSVWVIEFFANTRWANLDRQYSQKSKRGMS